MEVIEAIMDLQTIMAQKYNRYDLKITLEPDAFKMLQYELLQQSYILKRESKKTDGRSIKVNGPFGQITIEGTE